MMGGTGLVEMEMGAMNDEANSSFIRRENNEAAAQFNPTSKVLKAAAQFNLKSKANKIYPAARSNAKEDLSDDENARKISTPDLSKSIIIKTVLRDVDLKERRGSMPQTTVLPSSVVLIKDKWPPLVFSQFHCARWLWDFVVILALCWVTIFSPLQIAFPVQGCDIESCPLTKMFAMGGFVTLEVLVDAVFWVDIFVCFRTSFHDKHSGKEIFQPKLIAKRYMSGFFPIDFLSCIPGYPLAAIDLLLDPCGPDLDMPSSLGNIVRLVKLSKSSKLIKIARVVKIVRLGKILKMLKKIEERFVTVRLTVFKAISILGGTFIVAHLFGCMFIFMATADEQVYYTNSWIYRNGLFSSEYTCVDVYVTALYWSFTTMTTVGYGDVNPVSKSEKIFAIFAMLVGCITYSFIIVFISSLTRTNLNETVFARRMEEIKSYMNERLVPSDLRLEIQEYFKFYYKQKTALEEARILDMLTPQLKNKMRNFLVKDTLDSISFFKTLDNNAMTLLLSVLKPFKILAGRVLIAAGEHGSEMFFLVDGQMDIYTALGKKIKTVKAVTSFGELAMLALAPKRTATVVAKTNCELLCLCNKDMVLAFRPYPEFMKHIMEGARKKYAKLRKTDQSSFASMSRFEEALKSRRGRNTRSRRVSLVFNHPQSASDSAGSVPANTMSQESVGDANHVKQVDIKQFLCQFEERLDRKLQGMRSSIDALKQPERVPVSPKSRRVAKSARAQAQLTTPANYAPKGTRRRKKVKVKAIEHH